MPEFAIADFKVLEDCRFSKKLEVLKPQVVQANISIDTRTMEAGDIFWVIRGENFDGHDFIETAFEKGAAFAVVDQNFVGQTGYDEQKPLIIVRDTLETLQEFSGFFRNKFTHPVLALTGSNGKTTTKEMISAIMEQKMTVHKTEGNLNNHIGCPLTLLAMEYSNQFSVIELGTNHPGEISLLAGIAQPSHALVTNIGGAHLEFFGNELELAKEKLSLFDSVDCGGTLFLNNDDPWVSFYKPKGVETVTYSVEKGADVRGRFLSINQLGCTSFKLNESIDIQLQVPGVHNVANAIAASAVGIYFGLDEHEIKEGLEAYQPYSKRMELVERNGISILNDTYNANAISMKAAIETADSMRVPGRKFVALGDMYELGDQGELIHREVLKFAMSVSLEKIILVGRQFGTLFMASNWSGQVLWFENTEKAGEWLKKNLSSGDLLLLKGSRGMAMEKIMENL